MYCIFYLFQIFWWWCCASKSWSTLKNKLMSPKQLIYTWSSCFYQDFYFLFLFSLTVVELMSLLNTAVGYEQCTSLRWTGTMCSDDMTRCDTDKFVTQIVSLELLLIIYCFSMYKTMHEGVISVLEKYVLVQMCVLLMYGAINLFDLFYFCSFLLPWKTITLLFYIPIFTANPSDMNFIIYLLVNLS